MADLLSVDEARVVAGVSRATLYNWIKAGNLPSTIVDGRRMIERDDIVIMLATEASRVRERRARWLAEVLERAGPITDEQAAIIGRVFSYSNVGAD
jgi:excisionase family DNA binding protein